MRKIAAYDAGAVEYHLSHDMLLPQLIHLTTPTDEPDDDYAELKFG